MKQWIALVCLLLLQACSDLPVGEKFVPPQVRLADVRMADGGMLEQRFVMQLRVQNPNRFSIPIDGMRYQIKLNGSDFGSGVSNQHIVLPKNGEALVDLNVTTSLPEMLKALGGLIKQRSQLNYAIMGDLSIAGRGQLVPFNYAGELNVDALMSQ